MSLADQYREAYITMSPTTVADYLTLVRTIDPNAAMQAREDGVWIEFTDGSEWRLGSADQPANTARHHDS